MVNDLLYFGESCKNVLAHPRPVIECPEDMQAPWFLLATPPKYHSREAKSETKIIDSRFVDILIGVIFQNRASFEYSALLIKSPHAMMLMEP